MSSVRTSGRRPTGDPVNLSRPLKLKVAIGAICFFVLVSMQPAKGGRQAGRDASSPPATSGPLLPSPTDPSCDRYPVMKRDLGSPTVAVVTSCSWFFGYAPWFETDPGRDYFALWTQVEVDPKPGFCVDRIAVTRSIPDAEVTEVAPGSRVEAASDVSLRVDAAEHGLQDAMIEQSDVVTAGVLRGTAQTDGARYLWEGRSKRPVFLAAGLEAAQAPRESVATAHFGSEAVILRSCV